MSCSVFTHVGKGREAVVWNNCLDVTGVTRRKECRLKILFCIHPTICESPQLDYVIEKGSEEKREEKTREKEGERVEEKGGKGNNGVREERNGGRQRSEGRQSREGI